MLAILGTYLHREKLNTWVGFSSWRFSGSPAVNFVEISSVFFWRLGGDYLIWSSLSGCSSYVHSNRSKILPRSIKKNHRLFWKRKKFETLFEKFWKFWDRNIFDIFEIFHWNLYENKKNEIENFRKFFDLKKSKFFIENCMKNENFWDRKKTKIWVRKKWGWRSKRAIMILIFYRMSSDQKQNVRWHTEIQYVPLSETNAPKEKNAPLKILALTRILINCTEKGSSFVKLHYKLEPSAGLWKLPICTAAVSSCFGNLWE